MKKVYIAFTLAASIVIMSACSGGYTCPTYMQKDGKQMDKTETVETERV